MADKPIIFSAPMVNALLAGRKTQTRRVLKVQPPEPCEFAGFYSVPLSGAFQCRFQGDTTIYTQRLPYAVGDRLWVRETWTARMTHGWTISDARSRMFDEEILYRADGHDSLDGWWSSIHMPREFSRLTLTVTDVRVQRLQEISEADAWAEGCRRGDATDNGGYFPADETDPSGIGWRGWDCACDWYADLWNSLHGPGAWDANPWVAAYSFTVQHGNIDTQGDPQ